MDFVRAQLTMCPRSACPWLIAALIGAAACANGGAAPAPPSEPPPPESTVAFEGGVPSLDDALGNFRRDLRVVTDLAGGEPSREALVRRFVAAVERSDTNDLRSMVMSRAEFAYLYYPGSVYTRAPTRQAAPLVWFFHLQDSQKGVTRVLRRLGGRAMGYVSHECAHQPFEENGNTLWHRCVVRLAPAAVQGDTLELRLFGPIIERGGRFKLYSYANDF